MKIPSFFLRRNLSALVLLLTLAAVSAFAQTTAFTYQGRFTDSTVSQPTSGTYDFQFTLFNAAGTAIGAAVVREDVIVTSGTFTVALDFGATFDGSARTLEIAVRPGTSTATFTALTPRQPITSAPYAIQALNAMNAVNATTATTANAAVSATNLTGNFSGDVSGTQNATVVETVGGKTSTEISTSVSETRNATNLNVADAIVKRDPVGGFNAGSLILTDKRLSVDANNGSGEVLRVTSNFQDVTNNSGLLVRFRSAGIGPSTDRFRFDNAGGFVALGQLGYGIIPASGAELRFMWHPYKGAFRFGEASSAGEFNEANIGFYSFAGGNRTIANDFASFAFGDQVVVTGTSAVGFGANSTIDGNFGFSSGSQNTCIGFVCTAIGFVAHAEGQAASAIGYRVSAVGDHSHVLGRYGRTGCNAGVLDCTTTFSRTGSFVFADASINSYMDATANNQFNVRARGGIRLRTSTATQDSVGVNANTGCDIPGNSGVMSCASSRLVKENYLSLDGEEVLSKLRRLPVMQWNYIGDDSGEKHIGPFAEDFQTAFKLSPSDKSIGAQDLSGVALVGVQALEQRTANLQNENNLLKSRLEEQQKQIEVLKKIVCAIKSDSDFCKLN